MARGAYPWITLSQAKHSTLLFCMLYPAALYCTIHFTTHYTVLHTTLHCTIHFTAHYTILHTTLHCTLHCTAQYPVLHTTLHCTLHCTAQLHKLRSEADGKPLPPELAANNPQSGGALLPTCWDWPNYRGKLGEKYLGTQLVLIWSSSRLQRLVWSLGKGGGGVL